MTLMSADDGDCFVHNSSARINVIRESWLVRLFLRKAGVPRLSVRHSLTYDYYGAPVS